eukprot:SAG22_NODE_84_length_21617_cov_48.600102_4_plen_344_part_00
MSLIADDRPPGYYVEKERAFGEFAKKKSKFYELAEKKVVKEKTDKKWLEKMEGKGATTEKELTDAVLRELWARSLSSNPSSIKEDMDRFSAQSGGEDGGGEELPKTQMHFFRKAREAFPESETKPPRIDAGRLLASQAQRVPAHIKMYVLGLRGLLDPAERPYVSFRAPTEVTYVDLDIDSMETGARQTTKSATYVQGEDGNPDKSNPTFGEVVTIPSYLATAKQFRSGDVIQAQVRCKTMFGSDRNVGIATIRLNPVETHMDAVDEGQMDPSCTDEEWAELRDVYDQGLEETYTYQSPFTTWPIETGSTNTPAAGGGSIWSSMTGAPRVGKVGELKGFFRII